MKRNEAVALNAEKISLARHLRFHTIFQRDDSAEEIIKINARLVEIEKQLEDCYQ